MINTKNNPKKNSLIELMRFFFAIWVLYYHGYFPVRTNGFNEGKLAVEFFFVLSGFYLVRSIDKYTSLPLKNGLPMFLKHRFLGIAIPFIINEFFSIYYVVYNKAYLTSDIFGYLWYIRELFLVMAIIFILRKRITNEKKFYTIIGCFSLSTVIIFGIFPSINHLGTLRALLAMPLGMLAALLPKISHKKDGNFLEKGSHWLVGAGFLMSLLVCLQIAYMPKTTISEYTLKIIVYPAMIYFASCINFNCAFLNWLGSLSFLIYSFQCPLRILQHYGLTNSTHLFIILMVMVLAYSLIDNIVKLKKLKTQKGLT